LNGWDDIGLTMRAEDKISAFEKQQHTQTPWL
jgi:3-isopropylmalate dehydratase small subunit